MVTLTDGQKLLGTVLAVDFEAATVLFEPEIGPRRTLPFAAFRSLFLARTVELQPVPGSAQERIGRQRCTVRMRDAAPLEAQVAGLLARNSGLFLYVVGYGSSVLRWFIPAHAVIDYQVTETGDVLPLHHVSQPARGAAANDVPLAIRTPAQLQSALEKRRDVPRRRLGELLVQSGVLSGAQLEQALVQQAASPRKLLGEILQEMGVVSPEALREVLVGQLGVPCVDLAHFQFDPNALRILSPELARRHLAVPLFRTGKRLVVATENPLSWEALHEIEFVTGLKVEPAFARHDELAVAVAQLYDDSAVEPITNLVDRLGAESPVAPAAAPPVVTESDNTLVRLVNKMIVDAYQQGASDIHVESTTDDKPSRVRFRIDGVMRNYIDVPRNFSAALVSRIKIMAELDISEKRRPQDGKIRFENFSPQRMELRVVTLPTVHGQEDVVLRILTMPRALGLDQLGLAPRDLAGLKAISKRSFGLLFVCGPTGSGKTTTLHALLASINTPERKIWTVEDPVEITQEGLCQVQVNAKLGLTFHEVLRSFLRADPDVIMVGETRDTETARTVTAASLTGHLVFSTMHTNSAVESVVRLLDFGLDPFNFSDALLGILGQRLVRKLCSCKEAYRATDAEIEQLARDYCREGAQAPATVIQRWRSCYGDTDGSVRLYRPVGCEACEHSGYHGRVGIYELLVASPALKAGIVARADTAHLLRLALDAGMTTLEQDGIDKILQGVVDYAQVAASCR